jgi:hypothetical protein
MSGSSLQLKPRLEAEADCHVCRTRSAAAGVLWQGIHVLAQYRCAGCGAQFLEDLPVAHAIATPFRVDAQGALVGGQAGRVWFGEPLARSLRRPAAGPVAMEVEVRRPTRSALILNCLDYLYGHCVLKLLNATRHLREGGAGLVLVVPRFLEWMVPEGVAEVWKVDLPLQRAQEYFPELHRRIEAELARFDEVRLSRAYPHPADYRLRDFTRIASHDLAAAEYRVTFVWRTDRLWLREGIWAAAALRLGLAGLLRAWQRRKIRVALAAVRAAVPQAKPTVAGIGREGRFPRWIDDRRVERAATAEAERELCRVYAESRLVIGVHGSNMLLPSGHAGMCLDLMPASRWGNLAQDILYGDAETRADRRLDAFRVRFVPVETGAAALGRMAAEMVAAVGRASSRFLSGRDP